MADHEFIEILKSSPELSNAWRIHNPGHKQDFRNVELDGTNLAGTDLHKLGLVGASLIGADLRRADLRRADLRNAKLMGADLTEADLIRTDLTGANLTKAVVTRTNLSEALFHETVLVDLNLRSTIGLDSCRHDGPSVVDHRTLMRSLPLPLPFLRGCGLPDSLIDYLPSLLEVAVQFYSCFISYSTRDQEFATRLYADLQNKGVRCWFAPHKIQGGKKIDEQIDEAIRIYDRLLLILSDHSMNSEWVKTEIAHARQKELKECRRVLFPISIVPFEQIKGWKNFDADTGKDSAREIREYFIPDFSNWKHHDAYTRAFERLLKDLRSEKTAGA